MKPNPPPLVWAWLAAILVAVVIFDLLVLGEGDVGLRELLLAGVLSLAAGATILLITRALLRR